MCYNIYITKLIVSKWHNLDLIPHKLLPECMPCSYHHTGYLGIFSVFVECI